MSWRSMAAALGVACTVSGSAQDARPSSETAAAVASRLVSIGSVVSGEAFWSRDGTALVFPSASAGGALLQVPVSGGPPVKVSGELAADLVRPSPDGQRVAVLSDQSGNPEIWIHDLAGGERRLTDLGARINAFSWSPDGRTLALSALRYGQFDLFTVTVETGQVARLTSDPAYETYPVYSPDGRSLLFVRSDDRWADHDIMIMPAAGGAARVVVSDRDLFDYGTIGTRARFGYPLVSPDGRTVLFRSHRSGWLTYWAAPLEGGAPRALAPEPADQSDAQWSPDGRFVAFASNRNGTLDLRVVSRDGGTPRVVVPVRLGVVSALAWSPDGSRIAYTLATPTRPQDLHLVNVADGSTRPLTASINAAAEAELVTPEKVIYRSDDLEIPAYLFRPQRARAGVRHPGILLIHGGPTGQFSDTYLPQAQFLARMGYVVLAPNIRGSSGYGKAFEDANNPCWTHCDLRDVVAGATWLRGRSDVDGARLGITGNSYGGIMSLGAVAHAPEVFQAAVAQSGYADWISFQSYNAELQHTKLLAYEWGPYPDSAHVYRRNSAIFSAHRVTAPVFLLHGEGRTTPWRPGVLDIPASREFAHALERLNKVVQYRIYPGETYYVTGRENARRVMIDMHDFFVRYLGADLVPIAPATSAGRSAPHEQR